MTKTGHEGSWGDGNVLKLDCGDNCVTGNLLNHKIMHLKWVNFMVYKLYFNKAFKKYGDEIITTLWKKLL